MRLLLDVMMPKMDGFTVLDSKSYGNKIERGTWHTKV